MKLIDVTNHCAFVIDDQQNCHCFSYGEEVAAIINGEYVEYNGYKYYSQTSNRHKSMFRVHFGVEV